MCYTVNWSLGRILDSFEILTECGFEVKEIEASPWAFDLLLKNLQLLSGPSGSDEPFPSPRGDPPWVEIGLRGLVVRVTMKPPLNLTLDLPPKVPMPGE